MKPTALVVLIIFSLICLSDSLDDVFAKFKGRYDSKSEADAIIAASDAVKEMDEAIEEIEKNDSLLMEYVLAKDYCLMKCKENNLRKSEYSALMKKIAVTYGNSKSPFLDYALAILYGRIAESSNIIDAVKSNVANNVKKHAENVIKENPSIDGFGAYLILGRLHAMTPKVIYFTGWKSLNESEKMLKIYIEKNPQSITGKLYLAETYGMMKMYGEMDSLINEIAKSKPEKTRFYEDKAIIDSLEELSQ